MNASSDNTTPEKSSFWARIFSPLPWSKFNALGHSSVVKSSYLWVVLVPIVAKLLSHIQQDYQLPIFGTKLHLVLGVPFTWEVLYYAAIFFALANLTYTIYCPEVVQKFDKFADFSEQGMGGEQLILYAYGPLDDRPHAGSHKGISVPNVVQFRKKYCNKRNEISPELSELDNQCKLLMSKPIPTGFHPDRMEVEPILLPAAFWFVRADYDLHSPKLRWLVQGLYGVGFGLVLWILVKNFAYVVALHLGSPS